MKRLLLILGVNFLAFSTAFSTEQISDILIIGKDTFYLKSFPFDYLRIKEAPFEYNGYTFPHTGCYRGYIATWQIIDEILVLKEVQRIDSLGTQLNIIEYLKNNGYNPKILDGFVKADWYSDTLKCYDLSYSHVFGNAELDNRLYLSKDYLRENDKRIELVFENGKLIKNNIIPIVDYKVGNHLFLDVYYFQDWYIWSEYKKVRVKGVIRENDGRKVRLEILSFGTDKERIIRKVQKEMKDLNNFWVNPRYCKIVE